MQTRRGDQWGIIIGAIALIFASLLIGQGRAPGSGAPSGSSYNMEPDGLYAIYTVLAENNQAMRWERKPARLWGSRLDRLLLWDPSWVEDESWHALLEWVAQGHTLILAGDLPEPPGALQHQEANLAVPASIHPVTLGVDRVSVGGGGYAELEPPVLVHLALPDGTPVLVSWPVGEGRIYRSADPHWLSNAHIGQEQNLELALQLLTPMPGAQIGFDEYHHGYQAPEAWWQILRGPLQLFLLYLIAAVVLLYWAYGVRFGAPAPRPVSPPRAAVEYTYSMSQLYRRARARPVVLQAVHRSLVQELGRLVGGARGLSHDELAHRVAHHIGLTASQITSLLDRLEPERKSEPTEAELLALVRAAEEMQRRVRHAGFRDSTAAGTGTD